MEGQEESGEEDYMSDAFLQVTRGDDTLVQSREVRRKREVERRQSEQRKADKPSRLRKQIEEETRNQLLNKPLDSDNVGFHLLRKMGYRPEVPVASGSQTQLQQLSDQFKIKSREPIQVQVKSNRTGLGYDQQRQQFQQQKRESSQQKRLLMQQTHAQQEQTCVQDFLTNLRSRFRLKVLKRDFYAAQRSCFSLDQGNQIKKPIELFFWPIAAIQSSDKTTTRDDSEEDDQVRTGEDKLPEDTEQVKEECDDVVMNVKEQMNQLTDKFNPLNDYLREKYFFCIWCGCSFQNENELKEECPGSTREQHDL